MVAPPSLIRASVLVLLAGAFVGGFLGVQNLSLRTDSGRAVANSRLTYAIAAAEPNDTLSELLIVYIGSTTCSWSNAPELATSFRVIVDSLRQRAAAEGLFASVIGVDLDARVGREMQHLAHLGPFDQLSLGGGFANELGLQATWGDFAGPSGTPTPQVIVLRRGLRKVSRRGEPLVLRVDRPDVIARHVGLSEILAWVDGGVILAVPAKETVLSNGRSH